MKINVQWWLTFNQAGAHQMKSPAEINQAIMDIIAQSDALLTRVRAVKKDGSITDFVFSPAATRAHVVGATTERGERASSSRKANNPDLVNVYCIKRAKEKKAKGGDGWASFDLNRVISIRTRGMEIGVRSAV
jgi:hypothetical protein